VLFFIFGSLKLTILFTFKLPYFSVWLHLPDKISKTSYNSRLLLKELAVEMGKEFRVGFWVMPDLDSNLC
jgi:hypothetical protein